MKKLMLLFGMTEILFSIIAIMGLVIIGMAERIRKGYNIEPTKSQTKFNYFFGYLELKWLRLIRTLLIILIILTPIFIIRIFDGGVLMFLLTIIVVFLLSGLLSWVVMPFIIEEDEI